MSLLLLAAIGGLVVPIVSAVCSGYSNSRSGSSCYVGVQINTDGNEYRCTNAGTYNSNQGVWLDQGTASQVWVEFIRTSGATSWDTLSNSTRYQLSTTRTFELVQTATGSTSITGYFKFWDAASGGNLLQQTTTGQTWQATRSGFG